MKRKIYKDPQESRHNTGTLSNSKIWLLFFHLKMCHESFYVNASTHQVVSSTLPLPRQNEVDESIKFRGRQMSAVCGLLLVAGGLEENPQQERNGEAGHRQADGAPKLYTRLSWMIQQPLWYRLICVPQKIYWHSNPWYLWMRPHLEIGSLQMSSS